MVSRTLLFLTTAFASGIALTAYISLPWWIPLAAASALIVTAAAAFFLLRRGVFSVLMLAFFIMGYAMAAPQREYPAQVDTFLGKTVTVEGYVCKPPELKDEKIVYTLAVSAVYEGLSVYKGEGSVLLYVPGRDIKFAYGDVIKVRGSPFLPESLKNPGQFDYSEYLRDRGVWAIISIRDGSVIEKTGSGAGNPVARAAMALREKLSEVYRSSMAPEEASLINGMIFGGRDGIDFRTAELFNESGVVHILSVSGLHVGLVVAAVLAVIGLLRIQRASFPLLTGVLVFYSFITGMEPAVVRASVMVWLQVLGRRLGRERDWPTTLAVSALVILIFSPRSIFDPGFQLSFAATWGILHVGPLIDRWLESINIRRPWLRGTISVSLGAQAGTIPLVAYYYNIFSLASIPANLLAVPLVGVILPVGLLAGLSGLLCIKAAVVINMATSALLELMTLVVGLAHGIPGGVQYVAPPPYWAMAAWYFSLLALPGLPPGGRRKKLCAFFWFAFSLSARWQL